jgi:hypothetical protein
VIGKSHDAAVGAGAGPGGRLAATLDVGREFFDVRLAPRAVYRLRWDRTAPSGYAFQASDFADRLALDEGAPDLWDRTGVLVP